ncbi:MAG: hypothetical protein ACXWZB_08585, partial [Gaiellaceae bacterium]
LPAPCPPLTGARVPSGHRLEEEVPMHRKHLFPLVVLLAAAVVAGLLALTRTADLGQPAKASTGSDPAIALRLEELDRFELSLRQQLAEANANAPAATAPTTIYRRAAAPASRASASYEDEDEHEDEHEDEGRDD